MSDFAWRGMAPHDLDGVVAVAASAFPDHFEAPACFAERLSLFPQACFVLASDEAVKGYLIAYPQPFGSIPPLNSLLGGLPADRSALYLHDLALHPDVRGCGFTSPIVERLVRLATSIGSGRIHLVAVNGSAGFWNRMGFALVTADEDITRKLDSYNDTAQYMVRDL